MMKKMKLLQVLSSLLIVASVHAQQKHELTVKEAVDLAYKNVIELKNAQIDYRIQEAMNNELTGKALPQVNANAQANHYLKLPTILFPQSEQGVYDVLKREGLIGSGVQAPPPTQSAFSFQQPWNLGAGATLTQLLFQPDVFVGLQARRSALDYSQAVIDQAKDKVKDSAYKKYYAILVSEKELQFINETIQRLEKLYSDNTLMYKNGFAEKLDLDKVQVQLNNVISQRSVIENGLLISYAVMKYALGIPQADTIVLKEDLTVEQIKRDILDQSFSYESRAEIRTLGALQKLQKLDIKRYKLGYLPTVALAGNYTINGMGQKFFTDGSTFWFKSAYVGLNMDVPIFTGFQRKYKVQQAQLNLEKVNNNIENLKQGIDLEQVITRETLKTAVFNLDLQERNLELARSVYNATKTKFEQGLGSSFEVLQADTDFQNAQGTYFGAMYYATVAKISYLYSLGKLQ
jgi:outer membrane protein